MSMIKEFHLKCASGYKVTVERYNSAAEVVSDCKTRKITDRNFDDMQSGIVESSKDWYGVASYDEALRYLESGYQPTVEKLKTEIKANLQGQGKRISFYNDVVGYAPVVPLALLGVPCSMMNSRMKPIKAKVVDVYYDGAFNYDKKSEEIIKTGAKAVSMILRLEQQGYRFNLYQIQSYTDSRDCDMLCVKLKDAAQPIDLKRISFPMTHTGFFRVIGFDWYSKMPKARYRSGYGHSFDHEGKVKTRVPEAFKEMFGENAVYISGPKLLEAGEESEKYLKEVLTHA